MRLRLLFFLYCLSLSVVAVAQSGGAMRHYTAAMHYKAAKKLDKACRTMEHAIRKDRSDADAYSQLGRWYFDAHKFRDAARVFRNASTYCRNGRKQFAKPFAKCLLYSGRADSALQLINTFAVRDSGEWDRLREQAYFMKETGGWLNAPWPVNLGPRINSRDPELFPSMAVDSQNLYFTRRVNNMDDDFFHADYDPCGGWLACRNMGEFINTPNSEFGLFISADGHYLFFARCDNRSLDAWAEGGCDLFTAYRVANDSQWTIPQAFGANINTPIYEGMPSVSPDNKELYYVSDKQDGYGGYDIWISRFENGMWQEPVNAGPGVNSPGNETAPYINVDNKTLYFTSDYWPGMGGSDIFMSSRINDSVFGKAVNLGYPINTPHDEKSACVTLDGTKLYFGSDRQGPAGNFDIYETPLPYDRQPIPVSYLKGCVYDCITMLRLNYASIDIRNAKTGEQIYKGQSNRGDASYLITLHLNNRYIIHTERMGHKPQDDTIVFDKQYLQEPLLRNIVMLPSNYVAPVNDSIIATVHFDVNQVELSADDKELIRRNVEPWLDVPGTVVMVNAYTDNTGSPMINEELSSKRAEQVAKMVEVMGVSSGNIIAKGWGEAKMITTNETEEGRRINRRVEIVVRR